MGRSASFSGGSGAAWPLLSNGDAWDAAITTTNLDSTMYASLNSAVNGSEQGYIAYTPGASPPTVAALATTGLDTTTGAVSYLCPSVNVSPVSSANSAVNLLVLTSTHTASHFHVIDPALSTGSWQTMVFTKVGDYEYSGLNGGITTYTRVSAWTAYGTVATVGKFRFRTRTGAGNQAVGDTQIYSGGVNVPTLPGTDVISSGASYSPLTISGCLLTNNGADAIKYATNGASTGLSSSGTVSLPSALSRYSNQMLVAFSYYSNNNTGISSGTTITAGNYGTPSFGYNNSIIPLGTTTATRKVSTTTVFPGPIPSTVTWGALALEIQSAAVGAANDTWNALGITATRLAATTSYGSTEVRASNLPSLTSAHLAVRHCVVGGTRWWISYTNRSIAIDKSTSNYFNTIYLMKGDGTAVSLKDASWGTTSNISVPNQAVRVRNSAGGGLWISAKSWTTTEPAWPLSEGSGDTSGADWRVINVVDNANAGSIAIAGAGTGRNGLTGSTTVASASNSTWSAFSDLTWFDGSAALSGAGSLTADATRILFTGAAIAGSGSISSTATAVATAETAISGSGVLTASAAVISPVLAQAAISGSGSLSGTGILRVPATSSMNGAGSLSASASVLTVVTAQASISGGGTLSASAALVIGNSAALVGSGSTQSQSILLGSLSAAISGVGALVSLANLRRSVALSFVANGAVTSSAARTDIASITKSTGSVALLGQTRGTIALLGIKRGSVKQEI